MIKKSLNFLLIVLFKICLDCFYIFLVSPKYAYEGMIFEFNLIKYIFSWILFIFLTMEILRLNDNFLSICFNLEYSITILPLITYYALGNKNTIYIIYVFLCFYIQFYILNKKENLKKYTIYIPNIKLYCSIFIVILSLLTIGNALYQNGFHGLKAFDLVYLYEIRRNINYSTLFSYCVMWTRIVFIPFFILYNLSVKKYIRSLLFIILQIILYIGTGEKFNYLIILVILSFYIILTIKIKNKNLIIYNGLIFLILFLFIYKNYIFISLLGERFLFGPAVNKFLYYDFFSYYPKHYFADGIIGKCLGITYQYVATSGQLIFAFFYKGRLFESNSVTGYLGDGYAQAGFLGMILFTVLKTLLFKFISLTTNGVSNKIRIPLLVIPIILFNDAGFLTVLFSGGLFLIVLLLYIYPEKDIKNKDIVFIEYKVRDFFKILSLNSQKILLWGIIFIFSSIILSEVSFYRAVSNYYHYLKIGDSEFVKLIFKNYFEHSNKLKNILTAGVLGCILSSCFFILKDFIYTIKRLDKGENNVTRVN